MSKHSVTIRGLPVVTTRWSWAWTNRTSPSKWVGLGSPFAAWSAYGDLTCSVRAVNNLCRCNCQWHFYHYNRGPYIRVAFVPNMLSSWNKVIIVIIIIIIIICRLVNVMWINRCTTLEWQERRASNTSLTYEPPHDKTNKMTVRPAKTQISLGIRPVWSESSLCAQWVAKDPRFLHADSEDSDQTGWTPRLIWIFAWRTLTLLVLSCRGSYYG